MLEANQGIVTENFVVLEVAGNHYAVRSSQTLVVEMVGTITPIPRSPAFIEGAMAARGLIFPVMNVRHRFNLPEAQTLDKRRKLHERIVVMRLDGRTIGLHVDSAREFIRVSQEQIQPLPDSLSRPGVEFSEGLIDQTDRVISIINLSLIFDTSEHHEQIEQGPLENRLRGENHV